MAPRRSNPTPPPSQRAAERDIHRRVELLEEAVGYSPDPALDCEGDGLLAVVTTLLKRVEKLEAEVAAAAAAPHTRRARVVAAAKVLAWVVTTTAAVVGLASALGRC